MRTSIFIAILALLVGCNSDRGAVSRTAEQITKLRVGERSYIINPFPAELLSHSKDEDVVRNLTEISLTGDLAPYANSSFREFDQIAKIDLYCTTNTDQFLALLPALPNLTELYVVETDATDSGVISISECESLVGFGITSWGDALNMKSINELSNVTTLQHINLEISSQSNDLSSLREALPNCKISETTYSK